jgi:hypothetical protein
MLILERLYMLPGLVLLPRLCTVCRPKNLGRSGNVSVTVVVEAATVRSGHVRNAKPDSQYLAPLWQPKHQLKPPAFNPA